MTADGKTNILKARAAWGAAAPEWVIVLAEHCDASSQTAVAKQLGRSGSLINQVLSNCYGANGRAGRLDEIEQRVRGELMNKRVACPVVGEMTSRRCMDAQSRPYAATNDLRIEFSRACPRCPNFMRKSA